MMISQTHFKKQIVPYLSKFGAIYQKKTPVLARRAKADEQITTRTSDGVETTNTARADDYVVINQTAAREQYIVSPEKFEARYKLVDTATNGFATYQPIGKVYALKLTKANLQRLELPGAFSFEAPWGETTIAKTGDYLVAPLDLTEVYRIAQKEFEETYRLTTEK